MKIILYFIIYSLLISCAGPTSPFGGDVFISEHFEIEKFKSKNQNIHLDFYPERQYYNSPYNMVVKIKDPNFEISKFRYEIIYNHKKLNRWFKSETIKFPKDKEDTIEINFNNLSILPGNINKISFLYYPVGSDTPVEHKLKVPECFKENQNSNLFIAPFTVSENLKNNIKDYSHKYEYNPSLIAALIAQESSFKERSISRAWALGLTQVTPIAHQEIKKVKQDWSIYPNFDTLSLRSIKNHLESNIINAENDWRLDEKKSIEGGIIYLDYIKSYWSTPDKKEILASIFKEYIPEVDIYLASYNSGSYRVKKSLLEYGKRWLFDKNLHEARKYVMNIKSYCYAFNNNNQKGILNEK